MARDHTFLACIVCERLVDPWTMAREYLYPEGKLDTRFEGECGTIVQQRDVDDLLALLLSVAAEQREQCAGKVYEVEFKGCGDYYHDYCRCSEFLKDSIAAAIRAGGDLKKLEEKP